MPPTAITPGVVAGEPMLLNGPASPLDATTVTPAATAALSASETGSFSVFGSGLPPIDSLRMLTWSCRTAHSMPWMIVELKNPAFGPERFITARLAPGAMPSILMLQPGGSGWAGLTKPDRSYVWLPCEAIVPASRKASRPSVGALVPKPLKSS